LPQVLADVLRQRHYRLRLISDSRCEVANRLVGVGRAACAQFVTVRVIVKKRQRTWCAVARFRRAIRTAVRDASVGTGLALACGQNDVEAERKTVTIPIGLRTTEGEDHMKALKNEKGFTLIELLVVVAIIGILAAIAIPQFAAYRQRAFDARANSDLRNAATAEEAYFATNRVYLSCTFPCATLPGFSQSATVTGAMAATNGANSTFTGSSTSSSGSAKTFSYNSASGGMQP
jgi:type IV pilus assembly protein PilA